jgi:hypothetical protein
VTAQGYLALGLGQRAAELSEQLRLLDEVGTGPRESLVVGAVARFQVGKAPAHWVAVLPGGDATWLQVAPGEGEEIRVQVLSQASPLLRQLDGCEASDVEEVTLGGRITEVRVIEIQ